MKMMACNHALARRLFSEEALELVLKEHDPRLGNLVPTRIVHMVRFQKDLAATRPEWSIDEPGP
jgi:hypothetical protein